MRSRSNLVAVSRNQQTKCEPRSIFITPLLARKQYQDRNKARKLDHAMETSRTNCSRIPSCCGKFSLGNYFRETYFKTLSVSIQQFFSFSPAHRKIFKLGRRDTPFFKQFCYRCHNNKKRKIQQDVLPTDVKRKLLSKGSENLPRNLGRESGVSPQAKPQHCFSF